MTSLSINPLFSALDLQETQNGATSLTTSGSALVDLFYLLQDNAILDGDCHRALQEAWSFSPASALRCLFYVLDIRNGKACPNSFLRGASWLYQQHPETFFANLYAVVEFGSWKHILQLLMHINIPTHQRKKLEELSKENCSLFGKQRDLSGAGRVRRQRNAGTARVKKHLQDWVPAHEMFKSQARQDTNARLFDAVVKLFGEALKIDLTRLRKSQEISESFISLASKWLPGEGKFYDKYFSLYKAVADYLFPGHPSSRMMLRKSYLSPLRAASNNAESLMSRQKWSSIGYRGTPALCMSRNADTFRFHDSERFDRFIADAMESKFSLHTATLKPDEILQRARESTSVMERQLAEVQWRHLVASIKMKGSLTSTVAVVDVSGSMSGKPMEVAIALGLLTSQVTSPPWDNAVITFSKNPIFHRVQGSSLGEQYSNLTRMDWDMNTNYEAVFELILTRAIENKLSKEQMVARLLVLSDMQFDRSQRQGYYEDDSSRPKYSTTHEVIKHRFAAAGYEMPELVYWNLAGSHGSHDKTVTPVTSSEENAILMSGFSSHMLQLFMDPSEEDSSDLVEDQATTGGADESWTVVDNGEDVPQVLTTVAVKKEKKGKVDSTAIMEKAIGHERYNILKVVD